MKEPQPLDFEKPIAELQRRLQEIRDHSDEHALDFDAEVEAMEAKIETTRREIYGNLSAWQRVQIARHTQRPFALDYVERCFTNWNELHGDRLFGDDKAMPGALGRDSPWKQQTSALGLGNTGVMPVGGDRYGSCADFRKGASSPML